MLLPFLAAVAGLVLAPIGALGQSPPKSYNFTVSDGNQCGNLTVTCVQWGTRIKRIKIPADAQYTHTFDVWPWEQGQLFVATMQDASGWGSGGVNGVQEIGAEEQPCERGTENGPTDTHFYVSEEDPDRIVQCSELGFAFTKNVTLPARIIGIIPDGNTWEIPVQSPLEHVMTDPWEVNVPAGLNPTFAGLGSGEVGDMGFFNVTIGRSTQVGCFSNGTNKVTKAAAHTQPTETGVDYGTPSPSGDPNSGSSGDTGGVVTKTGPDTGTIVGAVVGSVAGAAILLGVLVWWLMNRARAVRTDYHVDLRDDGSDRMEEGTLLPMSPYVMGAGGATTKAEQARLDAAGHGAHGSMDCSAHSSQGISSPDMSNSQGYSAALLASSAGHAGAGSSSAGPTASYEPEVDAEAPNRQAGAAPPPSYDHVLWVTQPDGVRRPRARDKTPAATGGMAVVS